MHYEECGETADRYRDGVLNESGEKLYKKHDFVRGTDLPVEPNEITRARQVPDRNILIGDGFSLA